VIVLCRSLLGRIVDAAEAAYPEECCGLLVGQMEELGIFRVSRAEASRNLAAAGRHMHFEVDPQLRFDLMRDLAGGDQRIIGHYHSHPDHPAEPSDRDLEMAWEPLLAWLIIAVENGKAVQTAAFLLDKENHLWRQIGLDGEAS
jgi:proteasome lid subunit RPN8/RPN11